MIMSIEDLFNNDPFLSEEEKAHLTRKAKKLGNARARYGKPFVTEIPVRRVTEKSARLLEIERYQEQPNQLSTLIKKWNAIK
jgi:hypothetical protein